MLEPPKLHQAETKATERQGAEGGPRGDTVHRAQPHVETQIENQYMHGDGALGHGGDAERGDQTD